MHERTPVPSDPSDPALLERWRAGDRRAGHEFVARYFDRISQRFAALGEGSRAAYIGETFARVERSLAEPDSAFELEQLVLGHAQDVLDAARRRGEPARSGPLAETIDLDPRARQT